MYKAQIEAAIEQAERERVYFTLCSWVYPKYENKQRLLPVFDSCGRRIYR